MKIYKKDWNAEKAVKDLIADLSESREKSLIFKANQ
jgi:hypothetical protein